MVQGKAPLGQAMSGKSPGGKTPGGKTPGGKTAAGAGGIRDLADFHLRWHEFRPSAVLAAGHPDLSAEQHTILSWLVLLADRIGPGDLETGDETWLRDGGWPCRKDR
jgi:hypothetical protein